MIDFLSLSIAMLFSAGVWLILSRDWLTLILGLSVLGHAVNLLILKSGGSQGDDHLSQALILTAIVIGLGMTAVLLVLASQGLKYSKSRDADFLPEDSE
ncbi:sodium:proton antiporter [Bdellovibrio bacteriovorus]|uniref:sodium:proton antiporter n=1 Tax=Bdellovibrio bacteriovorus TaxID=959 RepID=UPI0002D5127B|nr:sodium:proton antiporter [Bdellovibrio bacteriovorus]